MIEEIKKSYIRKLEKILYPVIDILPFNFYLAGGAFSKSVHDLDLFPTPKTKMDSWGETFEDVFFISQTKNAKTVRYKGKIIQFCNYKHKDLPTLVDSFDFAHIQIGFEISIDIVHKRKVINFDAFYFHEAYLIAKGINQTYYTGSEYPLSSLLRLLKYHKRGELSKSRSIIEAIKIVGDIADRGFKGYDDFKDQLDAVDLGLVPEELDGLDSKELVKLFTVLNKGE